MQFQKGHKKLGGRKKGTKNKSDTEVKALLKSFVSSEIEALPERVAELTAKERCDVLKGLLPYIYPKKQEMDVKTEINTLLGNLDTLSEEQLARLKEIITEIYENEQ